MAKKRKKAIQRKPKRMSTVSLMCVLEGVVLIVLGILLWSRIMNFNTGFSVLLVLMGLRLIFFKSKTY